MGIGDWGLGIGDWGLGIGPNPQSPIPNNESRHFHLDEVTHPGIGQGHAQVGVDG